MVNRIHVLQYRVVYLQTISHKVVVYNTYKEAIFYKRGEKWREKESIERNLKEQGEKKTDRHCILEGIER